MHADGGTTAIERLPDDVWTQAAANLRGSLSEGNFLAWFGAARALDLEGNRLRLEVASPFAKDWITKRYLRPLEAAVSNAAGRSVEIELVAAEERPPEQHGAPPD